MSLNHYWDHRYKEHSENYYPFFFQFGGLLSFLCFDFINARVSLKSQWVLITSLLLAYFYVLFYFGEEWSMTADNSIYKFMLFCFMSLLLG